MLFNKLLPENEDARSRTVFMVLAFAMLILFTVVGFLGFRYYKLNTLNKYYKKELATVQKINEELEKEIKDFEIRLEVYDQMVDTKDSTLTAIQAEIDEKVKQIKELIQSKNITQKQLTAARKELERMRKYTEEYKNQIAELTKQNMLLADKNKRLQDSLSNKNAELDRIASQQEELAGKVSIGSKLLANDMHVTGIKKKGSGKEKETMNGSRMDWLKISFRLNKNELAKIGNHEFFVVILGQSGYHLKDSESDKFIYRGKEHYYTIRENIEFNNDPDKTYNIYWKKGFSFEEGTYKVELYCEDYLVGEESFNIK